MATASLNRRIRDGLIANLAASLEWPGPGDVQLHRYVRSNMVPPAIEIQPAQTNYHGALRDGDTKKIMTVRAYVGLQNTETAQEQLDLLLEVEGPTSVKAAIESDSKLGGACSDLIVLMDDGHNLYKGEAGVYLGTEWTVEIHV